MGVSKYAWAKMATDEKEGWRKLEKEGRRKLEKAGLHVVGGGLARIRLLF
jgi:CRISPR/Cas system Type II protein with McrA/HNH and RuvC-like nuclease domain